MGGSRRSNEFDPLRQWGRWAELAGAVIAVGAGVYLLQQKSAPIDIGGAPGQSWLEVLAHGIGAYFLARASGCSGSWASSVVRMRRLSA